MDNRQAVYYGINIINNDNECLCDITNVYTNETKTFSDIKEFLDYIYSITNVYVYFYYYDLSRYGNAYLLDYLLLVLVLLVLVLKLLLVQI